MRIVLFFAPVFLPWGKEIARRLMQDGAEVIGICATRQTYDALKADTSLDFLRLDNTEDMDERWAAAPCDPQILSRYEAAWGADTVRRLLIADRQAGGGYVTGGPVPHSKLRRMVLKNPEIAQRVTCGMLGYIDDLLEEEKPDAVLCYVIAGALALALAEGASKRGIRFYTFAHSRIGTRVVMDTSPRGQLTPVRDVFQAAQKSPELVAAHREAAQKFLFSFRDALNQTPEYEQRIRARLAANRRLPKILKNTALEIAKACAYSFVRGKRPFRGEPGWQKIWAAGGVPLGALWHLRSAYPQSAALRKTPFIYYALHVDPEASTMVLSPYHTDQLAVIEALSKAMPLSWRLVVKEHPTMLGRRPLGFYNRIRRMPGLLLAAPYENSLSLINDAALTATITGTVAWEALLLGRPALVVGASPYLMIGEGMKYAPDLSGLHRAIPEAVAMKPVSDAKILLFLSCLMAASTDIPMALLWDDPDDAYLAANSAATDHIIATLLGRAAA